MNKAKCIVGVGQSVPAPQGVADYGLERVRWLSFDVLEPRAVIPTVVTRESGPGAGAGRDSPAVPRQAFTVAPLLSIVKCCASPVAGGAGARASPGGPVVPPPPPRIDAAGLSLPGYAPGYKDRNQDSALLLDAFLSNRQQLLAVCDGHGPEGHRVSAFVRANLPFTLLSALLENSNASASPSAASSSSPSSSPSSAPSISDASRQGSSTAEAAAGAGASGASGGNGGNGGAQGPIQRALVSAVASLDAQLASSGIDVVDSGTTAALCYVAGRRLTAAWVGDSRLLLGLPAKGGGGRGGGGSSGSDNDSSGGGGGVSRGGGEGWGGGGGAGWRVAWSSTDHKPELPEERERIAAAGGRVEQSIGRNGPVGPYRVWFKDQPYPGLAMSRALGDLPGRRIGITAAPSLASLRLPDSGPALLVLASDGVWELLGNEQVLQLAAGAGSAAEAASRVVQQSRRAWVKEYGGSYIDDITAIVVRFDMPAHD
ncbi:hypothetical protein GPECTOR_132g597 [Gonium pectorale]|uniref:PPM-type phosphatase domain-containing protein n=1 Tax=Gonium pectorale TaxID=33097 RepID=A0A150FZE6_GONPE|nr:hypothetical protein GPECTOR_132g597 [Gonium pectorale]|eukprot:KXZ42585.1 hypothetical protein GPECTOR_132g597 [Gonium pectorale]